MTGKMGPRGPRIPVIWGPGGGRGGGGGAFYLDTGVTVNSIARKFDRGDRIY